MLNRPISFVIGVNQIDGKNEYKIIHFGASHEEAVRVFAEERMNEEFDLVGFQTMNEGFQRRAFPKKAADERRKQRDACKSAEEAEEAQKLDRAKTAQALLDGA